MNRSAKLAFVLACGAVVFLGQVTTGQDPNGDGETSVVSEEAVLGPVTATVTVNPAKPLIGDTVKVSIEVVSEPLVEVLMPEFGEALDRYRILDFAPTQEIRDDGKTLAKQTYRLQPPMSGKHSIPPILIEFVDGRPDQKPSPDDYDAYELLTPRIDFVVESVTPTDAASELKPPLGELQIGGDTAAGPRRFIWWVIGLVAIIAVACYFFMKKPSQEVRRQSAYEIARNRLDALINKPLPEDSDAADAFYVELSDIVRRYLEDRFELRAPEFTTEEFLEKVSASPDLNREHQELLREFLRQADLVKFAGVAPDEATIRASIESANRFIDETRPVSAEASDG